MAAVVVVFVVAVSTVAVVVAVVVGDGGAAGAAGVVVVGVIVVIPRGRTELIYKLGPLELICTRPNQSQVVVLVLQVAVSMQQECCAL